MVQKETNPFSRRNFLKTSMGAAGAFALGSIPTIVPAQVIRGKLAPSNRLNIGVIGAGRIGTSWDIPGTLQHDLANIMAVCDLDSKRLAGGKKLIDDYYAKKKGGSYNGTKTYSDHQELLADKDIDGVLICTPDHQHVRPALHAIHAGKDIYMEKPASLTITEGRILSDEANKAGTIFQIGSQQRSLNPWPQFKKACELVRNGRIGEIKEIYVGLPVDNPKEARVEKEMPIPANLNYEAWLGSTPYVPYTEHLVHPQNSVGARPGWLRCQQFGAGMITGWGAHHFDIVNWGLGTEHTGPVEVTASAEWPRKEALWDVHGPFKSETVFANGVKVHASDSYPNGVKFVGTEGWIFVTRGNAQMTSSDPVSQKKGAKAFDASNPKILTSEIGPNEIHLVESKEHHGNWLECMVSRQAPVAPIEVGHRACTICLINDTAMKLKRKLYWDPINERFKNDEEANKMLWRAERWPYQIHQEYDVRTLINKA
ncbi:Gfo/Idh/MocA family oxidoreductase [Compostibacter hankyongensis]|uniref:Gfo/Idh/MocA family oxidoreductase n=1 Tax=Compostibacter hankyongensis TaxID=1007089 RepID=A0ABP8FJ90_9BACT